jgi:benzoyl-CoA reductase subunit BamC
MKKTKKIVKTIKINADDCTGCRLCEAICSAFHADPEYGVINSQRSLIRIFRDEENDLFVPVLGGSFTEAECNGRYVTVIKGKEYGECSLCRNSCPSRDLFKEPDTELPLKCDMCGEPPLPEPLCVKWCLTDVLTYHEREEEVEVEEEEEEEGVEEL